MTIETHTLREDLVSEVDIYQLPYSNPRADGLFSNTGDALNFLFASLFPNFVGSFATTTDMYAYATPQANDYFYVLNDGDGRGAGYVYTMVDGVGSFSKKYDIDWSRDSILSDIESQIQPNYVLLTGREGGQRIAGSTVSGEDLMLEANTEDRTGNIVFQNTLKPEWDYDLDVGTDTTRIRDIYLAGKLTDGTDEVWVSNIRDAYDHIYEQTNPHNVHYDQLTFKLGTLYINGDATGNVDLSSSGGKTLTLEIQDDSHNHTVSTITDFYGGVWGKVKDIIQDNDIVTYTKDDATEKITPTIGNIDTTRINDIDSPLTPNRILASDGTTYSEKGLQVRLTGDVEGLGAYDGTWQGVDFTTEVKGIDLENIRGINLENLTCSIYTGNPALITRGSHGFKNGMKAYVKSNDGAIDGVFSVTKVDNDNFTIPVSVASNTTGFYIPENAQLLYDATTDKFVVRREWEEITHSELSGLNGDDHTQYVNKNGRSGGQEIFGGEMDFEHLTLRANQFFADGNIIFGDIPAPEYDNGVDLGMSSKRWGDVYTAGQFKGFRAQNVTSLPSSSGANKGRFVYNTVEDKLYYDNGLMFRPLSSQSTPKVSVTMTNEATKVVDVSAPFEDSQTTSDFVWSLVEDSTSQQLHCDITRINATQVQITLNTPITGTYILIGN